MLIIASTSEHGSEVTVKKLLDSQLRQMEFLAPSLALITVDILQPVHSRFDAAGSAILELQRLNSTQKNVPKLHLDHTVPNTMYPRVKARRNCLWTQCTNISVYLKFWYFNVMSEQS
jgi:hypothetical protein